LRRAGRDPAGDRRLIQTTPLVKDRLFWDKTLILIRAVLVVKYAEA